MTLRSDKLKRARPLLGTIIEISVHSRYPSDLFAATDHAFKAIEAVQCRMSFHDPASLLTRINANAANEPVATDEQTLRVLQIARDLYSLSDGIFDVTIAPELERAGFLPIQNDSAPSPDDSFAKVEVLPEGLVRFLRPGIRLDLGGIAKGFAVDEAVATLQAVGVDAGCVNAGGDLQVFGPDSFIVEIRDPRRPGEILTSFPIRNQAVATSGHYFADRLKPGVEMGPFVDPRLRKLVAPVLSVTIVAPDAVYADALTKIVMIDPKKSLPLLSRFNAAALMVDCEGSILCTPNWHATLQTTA